MFFVKRFLLTLILLCLIYHGGQSQENKNDENQYAHSPPPEKLSDEEQEARNALEDMNCVKKQAPGRMKFEVRALLVKCKKPECLNRTAASYQRVVQAKPNVPGFDSEECTVNNDVDYQHLHYCDKKIVLTVKIVNKGISDLERQYVIIDHVYDPISKKNQKLFFPYVLKIKQEGVVESYDLEFINVINSEPKEKIFNKNTKGYAGCSTSGSNPTCEGVKYNGETVPHSTGFCCSCKNPEEDELVTQAEKMSNLEGISIPDLYIGDGINYGSVNEPSLSPITEEEIESETEEQEGDEEDDEAVVPEQLKSDIDEYADTDENASSTEKSKTSTTLSELESIQVSTVSSEDEFANFTPKLELLKEVRKRVIDIPVKDKRGVKVRKFHKRGGQECTDNFTPPGADPNTYHDSAHCLVFSDLWYSLYDIKKPCIENTLSIQVYQKCEDDSGNSYWVDLTHGTPLVVGSKQKTVVNDDSTIAVHFTEDNSPKGPISLDYGSHQLLIPEPLKDADPSKYPELAGGPAEYLLVNKDKIDTSGTSCNKAGVGYEGFVNQHKRCARRAQSGLKNQPRHLWLHDKKMEEKGKEGKYFLKYHGVLPPRPIEGEYESNNKTLKLFFTGLYTSTLDMEIRADGNFILRPNYFATISEVYSDSTSLQRTVITVKVINTGLVSGVFMVSLCGFPLDVPASFNNIISKPALIAPQHQHIFQLDIECQIYLTEFSGNVEVLNIEKKVLAMRTIRIHRGDRCICVWHCKCGCYEADRGLKCRSLSLQQYHAAGYQGGLPVALRVVQYTVLGDLVAILLYIILLLLATFLACGVLKAIVGLFIVDVGLWGLDVILGLPKPLGKYFEKDIEHRRVMYDKDGWPVHPDTGRKVRNTALVTEVCINTVFFIIYPFAILSMLYRKLFLTTYQTGFCGCDSAGQNFFHSTPKNSTRYDTNDFSNVDSTANYSRFQPAAESTGYDPTGKKFDKSASYYTNNNTTRPQDKSNTKRFWNKSSKYDDDNTKYSNVTNYHNDVTATVQDRPSSLRKIGMNPNESKTLNENVSQNTFRSTKSMRKDIVKLNINNSDNRNKTDKSYNKTLNIDRSSKKGISKTGVSVEELPDDGAESRNEKYYTGKSRFYESDSN